MTATSLLVHGDGVDATHMSGGSIWMVLSMIAFSLFLLGFAWALLRPAKQRPRTAADVATERYAHGEIDAEDFERIIRDLEPHRR